MGGGGGIYYTAISQYCRDHEISGAEFEVFLRLIREIDDEYLKYMAEQSSKPQQDTSS